MERDGMTEDVKTLLGNPRRAVLSMAVPIAIGMIAQSANNLIDTFWVSGLGKNALAATGLVFPLFFILIAVGNGIGIGASALISRRIGEGDRDSADKGASQAFMLSLAFSAVTTLVVLAIMRPAFAVMGADGDVMDDCVDYGLPLFIGTVAAIHVGVMSSILRSEGAARRSMEIQIVGAVINMILDPVFIYGLDMGLTGAAIATVISMFAGIALACFWYFVKRDLYLRISLRRFRFDWHIVRPILAVGIPASVGMMVISLCMIFMNRIISDAGGSDGIAVYTTASRLIDFEQIPMMGIGGAVVPVIAAALGMRKAGKIREGFAYSVKMSVLVTVTVALVAALFAPWITIAFTVGDDTVPLRDDIAFFIRLAAVFLPFSAARFTASSLFEAFGMGTRSLVTILVINMLQIPCCAALVYVFGGDLYSVFYGICATEMLGSVFAVGWSCLTLRQKCRELGDEPAGDERSACARRRKPEEWGTQEVNSDKGAEDEI